MNNKQVLIDIFNYSVVVVDNFGNEKMYYIQEKDEIYYIFTQKRKPTSKKWSKARLIDTCKDKIKFIYDSKSDLGARSIVV